MLFGAALGGVGLVLYSVVRWGLKGFEMGFELALKGRHSLDIQQHSLTNNNET